MKSIIFFCLLLQLMPGFIVAQRSYTSQSVLSNGAWYKIAVNTTGVYKVDANFMNSLGINTTGLASSSIGVFGNGGEMLPESNFIFRKDDLVENAIEVVDGGDGIFSGGDYFLFYAAGPDVWTNDSINRSFNHQKNLFSNVSYYYISIGGAGKRISTSPFNASPNINVTTFNERIFHELDTLNFLKSGKQWYGEEFSNTPGNALTRSFNYTLQGLITASPITLKTAVVGRSVGGMSRFEVRMNSVAIQSIAIPSISGNVQEAFAVDGSSVSSTLVAQSSIMLNYTFIPGSFNAQGWLNWFELFARRSLSMLSVGQQTFRDWSSVGAGNVASINLTEVAVASQVWEITDPLNPVRMQRQGTGNLTFVNDASRLREYIYFNGSTFFSPVPIGRIANQNLHLASIADYIIVAPSAFRSEANRLAAFHAQNSSMRVTVADIEEVYNEFSSGIPDPGAVRDFAKMFYDRAGSDTTRRPKYLLLFGDASFDYKSRISNNTNRIPCYQSVNSLDPLASYTSDDFFGLLDDADDINLTFPAGLLDIGVGRVPANTLGEAKIFVDKVISYHSPSGLGSWRNQITFVADDEDANLHVNDAEIISETATSTNPLLNKNKIYLDAYRQEGGASGSRYPEVNRAVINQVFTGNLVWNYTGHGGSMRLAEEAVLDQDVFNQFNNPKKLPLFITATCDFAPYDDPAMVSLGEKLLLQNNKGAIALTTTTRLVFAFSNRIINNNYLQFALQPNAQGQYRTLGEGLRAAKNFTYSSSPDVINNRKFTLLGDPAMKLALPTWRIKVNTINGRAPNTNDTIRALDRCTITGSVTDVNGSPLTNFNGTVFPTIFDKPQQIRTLANDPGSLATNFNQQTNTIFKGKATVSGGNFSFNFIVPKDVSYQAGKGRVSLYAENGSKDANGVFTELLVGGQSNSPGTDNAGPIIRAYLNDEKFVQGGLVNETPVLILRFADSSGINVTGSGIGHDLTAVLDGDDKNVIVLNDFYEGEPDNATKGTARFQLSKLAAGVHSLKIKAWDAANNSSEIMIEFVVANAEKLVLRNVLNYPNPFTTKTTFWFEHNQSSSRLLATIQVFSVSGKLVHQMQQVVQTSGNRSCELEWDGKDAYGSRVGRGVYIYRLSVTGEGGTKAEKIEKLYVL